MLEYSLSTFRRHPEISEIILVVVEEDIERAKELISTGPSHITEKVVVGGKQRRDSVWHGLQQVTAGTDSVLIHDAARPFISHRVIDRCLEAIRKFGAAVVSRPVADTLKRAAADNSVAATVERDQLWGAQTPQGGRTELLLAAFSQAMEENWSVTDDASVIERAGHRVQLVEGEGMNFKITHPEDLAFASRLLTSASRTGFGYDVHRLVTDRELILGGVHIPHTHGLHGHSDADVVTHAIMDALLGAAALGDIGQHFPDSDDCFKGICSLELLENVSGKLADAGFVIVNIDATIAAQAPKLAPYIAGMRSKLASATGLSTAQISIKATTTEGLGFIGTKEGMAAYATVAVTQVGYDSP